MYLYIQSIDFYDSSMSFITGYKRKYSEKNYSQIEFIYVMWIPIISHQKDRGGKLTRIGEVLCLK